MPYWGNSRIQWPAIRMRRRHLAGWRWPTSRAQWWDTTPPRCIYSSPHNASHLSAAPSPTEFHTPKTTQKLTPVPYTHTSHLEQTIKFELDDIIKQAAVINDFCKTFKFRFASLPSQMSRWGCSVEQEIFIKCNLLFTGLKLPHIKAHFS